MKSFAAATLIGATSAEPSSLNFITAMAIKEAEAAKFKRDEVVEMNPLDILTSMALDEMEN